MEGGLSNHTLVHDQDDSISTPENVADSPLSGYEAAEEPILPPLKKSRRGAQKRVVSVPIGGADGSPRTKGEVYPPSDSWSWRKYGQKPIKGSPYPRGYYRCSSSKGCPARKQVERSRLDPTMLLITYSHEHNHPLPTTTNKHHHRSPPTTATTTSTTSTTSSITTTATADNVPSTCPPEEFSIFTNQRDLEADSSGFSDLTGEFGWFSDVGSTTMLESPTILGTKWAETDVAVMLPIGEEDQSLFGDLEELPEYSVVSRRRCGAETPCYGGTG